VEYKGRKSKTGFIAATLARFGGGLVGVACFLFAVVVFVVFFGRLGVWRAAMTSWLTIIGIAAVYTDEEKSLTSGRAKDEEACCAIHSEVEGELHACREDECPCFRLEHEEEERF
jgi:hypothetical protein